MDRLLRGCHPAVSFSYFALVIACTMFFMHPLCLALSLLGAGCCAAQLVGGRGLRQRIVWLLPMALLAALVNPAFVHQGATILTYFPSGNPLTLESILYGCASGVLLAAVVLWFVCVTDVITSDKVVYLFGRIIPALSLLLSMHAYVGELERTASFKDKIRKHADNVNIGLLSYPVLMAADILQHRATRVPVGKDQEQHLELTRRFARRFNQLYQVEFFPECQPYTFGGNLVKIPGLDGNGKMGKSEGNGIFLSDTDEAIRKKVMKAVTDSGPTAPDSPMPEVIANLFTLLKAVSTEDTVRHFTNLWNRCEIRYGDLKKQLAEDMIKVVAPIRTRIQDIIGDDAYLSRVVKQGAEKARESSSRTLSDVRRIKGIKPF